MPSERLRGCRHSFRKSGTTERGHRILALARALKDVAAIVDLSLDVSCLARNANRVLDLVVIRFEFVVVERPVFNRRAFRNARSTVATYGFAAHLEIPRIQTPALTPVVNRRPADGVHHRMDALNCRN